MRALRIPELDAPPLVRYGLPEYLIGENPAAGAHYSEQAEGSFFVRLLTLHVRLVTDANVANRTVVVEYRDQGDNRFAMSGSPTTQSASSTNDWLFSVWQEQAEWSVDDCILVPLAPVLLLPTFDYRVFVDNVQAGDQLSRVRIMRERFYTTSQPPVLDPAG